MGGSVSVLQVGIGGYGNKYTKALLENENNRCYKIVGIVDPVPEGSMYYEELRKRNILLFNNMEDFYKNNSADLVIISSPIHFHKKQSILALSKGSNVLCEKPMCATVNEGLEMIRQVKRTGKRLGIGYQWSFSKAILDLKKDIAGGLFGKPLKLKTMVLWARPFSYYNRNRWAGKKQDENGNYIFDSVANNATAHYLHNMFFVLGDKIDRSIKPLSITAELYCANDIENFDTCTMRIYTENDVEIMYIASHAVKGHSDPNFCYEFENAYVVYNESTGKNIVAIFKDGTIKQYGNPQAGIMNKLWLMIDDIHENKTIPCTPQAAFSHTLCIDGAQKSVPHIVKFPGDLIRQGILHGDDWQGIYVEGLSDVLRKSYINWEMPSEMGIEWAEKGNEINIPDYEDVYRS